MTLFSDIGPTVLFFVVVFLFPQLFFIAFVLASLFFVFQLFLIFFNRVHGQTR